MRRFFTEPENIHDGCARILEDAAHISRVLRLAPGDEILLFDGTGYEYTARITELRPKECLARIKAKTWSRQEPKVQATIFQGLPKAGKMEDVIQKSVELGAAAIVPTLLERCVVRWEDGKKGNDKLSRWNKVAQEAAKQCGRGILPRVLPPVKLPEALRKMQAMDLALMPYELLGHLGRHSLRETISKTDFQSVGILIGPEGGFTDAEAELAKSAGVAQVGLGRRILRTETVAGALLSILMYEKNEL